MLDEGEPAPSFEPELTNAAITFPLAIIEEGTDALLEKLDDLSKDRAELNARVVQLAATDDITPRVLKAASGMEQWVNVQPAMFEDILDEELLKFEKFRAQLNDDEQRQTELLQVVQVGLFRSCLSLFALGCIRSRRVMTLAHEWLG